MAYTGRRRTTPNANKSNYDSSGKRTFTKPTTTTTTTTTSGSSSRRRPTNTTQQVAPGPGANALRTVADELGYEVGWDAGTKKVTVMDPNSGKAIMFNSGEGSQYGLGGLSDKGYNTVTDVDKFKSNFSGFGLSDPMREVPAEGYTPEGTWMDKSASMENKQKLEYYGMMRNKALEEGDVDKATMFHNLAEGVRVSMGYLGGVDGSKRTQITTEGESVASSVDPGEVTPMKTPGVLDKFYSYTPQTPELKTVQDLSKEYLGDITYDEDAILSKFQGATRDEFAQKGEALRGAESQFGRNLFDTGLNARDALRRANASAVATGASRGVQAAQELSSILGLEQEATGAATELAQARSLLGLQEAEALSKDVTEAMTTANAAKMGIGQLGRDLYTADTQFRVGEMDYYANLENTIKNLEGILAQAGVSKEVADINRDGQITAAEIQAAAQRYGADKSYQSYTDTQRLKNIASKAASGTATENDQLDYAATLADYVKKGDKDAYISVISNQTGYSKQEAEEMWDEANGFLEKEDEGGFFQYIKEKIFGPGKPQLVTGEVGDTGTIKITDKSKEIVEDGTVWIAPYKEFYKDVNDPPPENSIRDQLRRKVRK